MARSLDMSLPRFRMWRLANAPPFDAKLQTCARKAVLRNSWDQTRPDLLTAERLEVAIQFQALLGTGAAAQYLEQNDVALELSVRILTRPWLRRSKRNRAGLYLRCIFSRLLRRREPAGLPPAM